MQSSIYLRMTLIYFLQGVHSQCTFPVQFQNSVWVDSDKGELVFGTVDTIGWEFPNPQLNIDGVIEEWECFHTETVGTKLYLILKSKVDVSLTDKFSPYLCMEMTAITSYSYHYYLPWAEESKFDYERITSKFAATTITDPIAELCLDSTIPTHAAVYPEAGEYHVLIKQGHENDSRQECPSTFFGIYWYTVTDIDGSSSFCGNGNETWDVCTDYKYMTFDYNACNQKIAYSGSGSVFCLASVTSGSYTYHTVYNSDATVDYASGTYRFTCFTSSIASDGSLQVSQTPGSCKKGQTPTAQPIFANNGSAAGLNLELTPRRLCRDNSQCTFPVQFQNSVWVDSAKGELVFGTVDTIGWDFPNPQLNIDGVIEDWECFHTETVGTKLYLILKSKLDVTLGDLFSPYLCMELTEITSYSYRYYLLWSEESKYDYERITAMLATTKITDPIAELCLDSTIPEHADVYPENGEYNILIKQGNENDAKQECPSTFFGVYWYNVTDIDASSSFCGIGNETWDVCTDYKYMTFDYNVCNQEIAYSGSGSVFCLASVTSGSYTYHTVYNADATVDYISGTYRFTCFTSIIASDGSLQISQTPGSCKKGQTPTAQPIFANNGSVAGLNLNLTPRRLCPKTADDNGLSTGAIIGIVFGVLIFIAATVLIVLLCMKMGCRQPKEKQEPKSPVTSPRSNKLSISIDDMPHERSPHWIDGTHGTAPIETKFSGDHTISKSPTLDDKFNPFSVLPLANGKVIDDISERTKQTSKKLIEDEERNKTKRPVAEDITLDYAYRDKSETQTAILNMRPLSAKYFEQSEHTDDNTVAIAGVINKKQNRKEASESPLIQTPTNHSMGVHDQLSEPVGHERVTSSNVTSNDKTSRNSNLTPKSSVLEPISTHTPNTSSLEQASPIVTDDNNSIATLACVTNEKQYRKDAFEASLIKTPINRIMSVRAKLSESIGHERDTSNEITSRNSNSTAKSSVFEPISLNTLNTLSLEQTSPIVSQNNNEIQNTSSNNENLSKELESPDKEVIAFSQNDNKQTVQYSIAVQKGRTSMTPVSVTESSNYDETVDRKTMPSSETTLPDNPRIVQTHFKREDLKYAGTFLNLPKSHVTGPNNDANFKERTNNKVIARTHTSKAVTEKPIKRSKTAKSIKVKGKSNKRADHALSSILRSKTMGGIKNKKGTFYNENIPVVSEPDPYLNLSELNTTSTGICYDDDNVRARALGYWNNDTLTTNVSNYEDNIGGVEVSEANDVRHTLDTPDDRSTSRQTISTDMSARGSVSARSISAITGMFDSKGARYFIENESSTIAIHMKYNDVPEHGYNETINGDIDCSEADENQEYNENDDDEEDDQFEDFNASAEKGDVETYMEVVYGTVEDNDGDPDRMDLRAYEPDLLTIKE